MRAEATDTRWQECGEERSGVRRAAGGRPSRGISDGGTSRSQCRVGGESDPVAVTLCGAAWLPREESRRRTVRKADALRQRRRVSAGKVEGSGV